MVKLFSEFQIKGVKIPNRVVMPPMCQYVAEENGKVNNWHLVHYGTRAVGKVGLIILEATAVEPRGRITDRDLGIWNDEQINGLKDIVDFGHQQGSIMGIQLAHAGRKSEISNEESVIGPSPIPYDDSYVIPREMTKEDIKQVVQAFADAAARADQAGFDLIELHGAHGYLIHEFLSPLSNRRTDEYGSIRENRTRFLKEIIESVKKVWPEHKPIVLRISATDFVEGGIDLQEMIGIIKKIKGWGVDLIDVSAAGLVPINVDARPGYLVKFAEQIKHYVGIPTITVGLISEPEMAEEIIHNDRADLVEIGRELLRNPYWTLEAAKKLGYDLDWPQPYLRAKNRLPYSR